MRKFDANDEEEEDWMNGLCKVHQPQRSNHRTATDDWNVRLVVMMPSAPPSTLLVPRLR
jgi:hypothetical protein